MLAMAVARRVPSQCTPNGQPLCTGVTVLVPWLGCTGRTVCSASPSVTLSHRQSKPLQAAPRNLTPILLPSGHTPHLLSALPATLPSTLSAAIDLPPSMRPAGVQTRRDMHVRPSCMPRPASTLMVGGSSCGLSCGLMLLAVVAPAACGTPGEWEGRPLLLLLRHRPGLRVELF